MPTATRSLPAVLFIGIVTLATPACASHGWSRYPQHPEGPSQRVDRQGYDNGYRRGYDEGVRDARRGRSFDHARHNDFRNADRSYGGYGTRGAFQRAFRDGFISGYNDGYRQYARVGRDRGGWDSPRSRNEGGYGYPGPRGDRGFRSPAADNGYRDGYAQGQDDGRDGDRYDPVRASRYRSGDAGYDRRDGSRDAYKRDYRLAFQDGYRQGYQEWRGR